MEERGTLATTTSLCPDCLEQVPGQYEEQDDGVVLTRECPDHGTASRQVWGSLDHWEWAADFGPDPEYEGGSLAVDDDHACLAVVEVTEDCNLSCSYCFASSGPGGAHRSTEEIEALLDTVETAGGRPIQFSGGEPTVRDDLPELVERARSRGIDHVEVNTNGIRLAISSTRSGPPSRLVERRTCRSSSSRRSSRT
ncbi:MAG: radical SAM protein [Halobaculum sp.]